QQDDEDEAVVPGPPGRRPATGGPVVAVRVRASVGRPGASAHAEYRHRRGAETAPRAPCLPPGGAVVVTPRRAPARARWTHGLPWRVAVVLAAAVAAGLLATQVAPDLAGLLAVAVAAGLGWWLRWRPSTHTPASRC